MESQSFFQAETEEKKILLNWVPADGADVSAGEMLARSLSEMKFKQGPPAGST